MEGALQKCTDGRGFHLEFKLKELGTITIRPKLCPCSFWVGRAAQMEPGLALEPCTAQDPEDDDGKAAVCP